MPSFLGKKVLIFPIFCYTEVQPFVRRFSLFESALYSRAAGRGSVRPGEKERRSVGEERGER